MLKEKEKYLGFLEIKEEYIKDEMKNLKRELIRAKEVRFIVLRCHCCAKRSHCLLVPQEVKRIQSVPLVIGQFLEMVDVHYGIVSSTAGSNYYVRVLRYVFGVVWASQTRPCSRGSLFSAVR